MQSWCLERTVQSIVASALTVPSLQVRARYGLYGLGKERADSPVRITGLNQLGLGKTTLLLDESSIQLPMCSSCGARFSTAPASQVVHLLRHQLQQLQVQCLAPTPTESTGDLTQPSGCGTRTLRSPPFVSESSKPGHSLPCGSRLAARLGDDQSTGDGAEGQDAHHMC